MPSPTQGTKIHFLFQLDEAKVVRWGGTQIQISRFLSGWNPIERLF